MIHHPRKGIKLIELLVIVAIIAIVVGLLLPAKRRIPGASTRMRCANNLKQIMLAIHEYESINPQASTGIPGAYPTGCIGTDGKTENRLSWMVSLLPYIEEKEKYKLFDLRKSYEANETISNSQISIFYCLEAPNTPHTEFITHYIAMAGIGLDAASKPEKSPGNGFMGYERKTTPAMITDGLSNTIALMETRSNLGPWARGGPSTVRGFDPKDTPCFGPDRPFGGHPGGFNVAMADGSVQFLRNGIDPQVIAAAITIAGNEPFSNLE